jgi:hypothetical protein
MIINSIELQSWFKQKSKGMRKQKEPNFCELKVQKYLNEFKARPDWIAGFVAGEGCITAYLNKQREGSRYPFQIQPAIIIVQHQRDIEVLYKIQRFFDCGQVSKNKGKNDTESKVWQWRTRDIKILCNVIIPFFEKNQILSTKDKEFLLFKELCYKMQSKYHLKSIECYTECVNLAKDIAQQR